MNTLVMHDGIKRWATALETKDPERVTACYTKHAILVPTLSNVIRTSSETIRQYFDSFLKKEPRCTVTEAYVQTITADTVLYSGTYVFSFVSQANVTARFSFVFTKGDDLWHIVSHHSSACV